MASVLLHAALILCVSLQTAYAIASSSNLTFRSMLQAGEESFTQNSLCRQNNCVNPIFPGLNDLPRLEALTWQCATQTMVKDYMSFCKDAVLYDPALPSPKTKATSIAELIKSQDDAAMTMFTYHLSGMGYEAWDYQTPSESDNDCVRSVWKMVCFTYYPRANAGCQKGQVSLYQRPCQSSCHNYIAHCGVECCDESVQCTFTHTKTNKQGAVEMVQTGYVDENGPSAKCTGGARRTAATPFFLILAILGFHWSTGASSGIDESSSASFAGMQSKSWKRLPMLIVVAGLALSLQGCGTDVDGHHSKGNWRVKQSYLNSFKYVAPGKNPKDAILNSCAVREAPPQTQCSGRGYCKAFNPKPVPGVAEAPLAFCSCEPGWADPECSTQRKSQMTAFFYSLFLGMFGADYFYLGFPWWAIFKLLTLGGFGFWWLIDIIRIAAGPVYAYNFRTSNDLPHTVAMMILFFLFTVVGFCVAIETYLIHRKSKREDVSRLQHETSEYAWQTTKRNVTERYRDVQRASGSFDDTYGSFKAGQPQGWHSL